MLENGRNAVLVRNIQIAAFAGLLWYQRGQHEY